MLKSFPINSVSDSASLIGVISNQEKKKPNQTTSRWCRTEFKTITIGQRGGCDGHWVGNLTVTVPVGTAGLEALSGSAGRGRRGLGAARLCPGLCQGCARLRCSRGQRAGRRPGPGAGRAARNGRAPGAAGAELRSAHGASTPRSCTQELAFLSPLPVRILLALRSLPASLTLNITDFSCFISALYSV